MTDEPDPVEMRRFWFTTWREDVLFHASPACHHLENNVTEERAPHELPVAHIPVDASVVGSPPKLKFCSDCVREVPFE